MNAVSRLAFFLSRGFNQLLADQGRKPLFAYLCSGAVDPTDLSSLARSAYSSCIAAGGDEALIASKESAEDDPRTGAKVSSGTKT